MKIALYIEDGFEQIVLTPETKTEHALLGKLGTGNRQFAILHGSFYKSRGGWMVNERVGYSPYPQSQDDESTIIVLEPREKPTEGTQNGH